MNHIELDDKSYLLLIETLCEAVREAEEAENYAKSYSVEELILKVLKGEKKIDEDAESM